jgi:hypothetical protein
LKRQHICYLTFGFLLGLVGCTERNPAFHKTTDGGASPPQDTAALDTPVGADRPPTDAPVTPKDAELGRDTPDAIRDTRMEDSRLVDGEGDTGVELHDARVSDGGRDTGAGFDTTPAHDTRVDVWRPDGSDTVPTDVPPASPDAETADVPTLAEDAPLEIDGPEADVSMGVDVLPDAEEPDAWPDAEDTEPDAQLLTDV